MPRRRRWLLAFVTAPIISHLAAATVLTVVDRLITAVNPGGIVPRPQDDGPHFDAFMSGYVVVVSSIFSYLPGGLLGVPVVWLLERMKLKGVTHYAGGGVVIGAILMGLVFALVAARWPGESLTAYPLSVLIPVCLAYGVSGMLMVWWIAFRLGASGTK